MVGVLGGAPGALSDSNLIVNLSGRGLGGGARRPLRFKFDFESGRMGFWGGAPGALSDVNLILNLRG